MVAVNGGSPQAVRIVVSNILFLDPPQLPDAFVGASYSFPFHFLNTTGSPRYSLAGNVPAGLTLTGSTLGGTPTASGFYSFNLTR